MIDFLAKILSYLMRGCYFITKNYIVSLLLFAIVIQLLMALLFGIKQQKNMVKQASLRPKEMAIRKKYAGRTDKVSQQKCQQEVMQLYQKEGYNAMAGCLPMIIQLILVFPIYQIVIRPLEFITGISEAACQNMALIMGMNTSTDPAKVRFNSGYQIDMISRLKADPSIANGEAFTEIVNAGGVDALPKVSIFGVDLGVTPWDALGTAYWLLVLVPILNLGFMYLSQFLTKKFSYQNPQAAAMNGSSMKIMMYVLPLMTMFITFQFASAIGIYWIFRTILSIAQQFIFYKLMPYPQFTEEDYRNAEREYKGKSKGREIIYPEGQIRSLHHIDDDEDVTPKKKGDKK